MANKPPELDIPSPGTSPELGTLADAKLDNTISEATGAAADAMPVPELPLPDGVTPERWAELQRTMRENSQLGRLRGTFSSDLPYSPPSSLPGPPAIPSVPAAPPLPRVPTPAIPSIPTPAIPDGSSLIPSAVALAGAALPSIPTPTLPDASSILPSAAALAGAAIPLVPKIPDLVKVAVPVATAVAQLARTALTSPAASPPSAPTPVPASELAAPQSAAPLERTSPPVRSAPPSSATPQARVYEERAAKATNFVQQLDPGSVVTELEFRVGPHAEGELGVLEVRVEEELSRPFSVRLTLVAREGTEVDPASLLGQEAALSIRLDEEHTRYLHGVLAQMEQWDTGAGADRNRFVAVIVPSLWRLGHRKRCRIFQGMTVPEIVQQVFREGGVAARLSLSAGYRPRDYCVQYRESDFDFVSRLLEEEGIFYSFEHEQDGHTVVLRDSAAACPDLPDGAGILFRDESGMTSEEHVFAFRMRREVRPSSVALRDFNFLRPALDMTTGAAESASGLGELEIYDYPGRYDETGAGAARSRTRLEELRVSAETGAGTSTSRRLAPGQVFELLDHPVDGFNGEYLILSVSHHGWQPEALHSPFLSAEQRDRRRYESTFVCLRKGVPFRPERKTPRPTVPGPQTAIVVGPASEEIFTDLHGRVKVQFHWDREGKRDERSSCWIRVSQAWAGPGWGALYLPRVGHEVVVEFEEGDPDRPLVTGSVYNGVNPPPISLPADKTKSTLRSASSPGGHGSNELRFEDAAGGEEVYLHAQKDLDIVVENDKSQHVGRDETLRVDRDRSRSVGGNQKLLVEQDDATTVDQDQSLAVALDRTTTVGGDHTETIGGDQSVSIGASSTTRVALAASETIGLAKALTVGAAYAVTVGAAMNELVGGSRSEEVGGSKSEVVGGKKSERVGGSRTLQVGGSLAEMVGGSRTLKVQKELVLNVDGTLQHAVKEVYRLDAKKISLAAGDEFVLKVGSATIQVTKSGDLIVNGTQVSLNASGPLTLKGSTVSEN
jgi:type VI secretion system secreted protein VgrG